MKKIMPTTLITSLALSLIAISSPITAQARPITTNPTACVQMLAMECDADENGFIGEDRAIQIALDDAKISRNDAQDISAYLRYYHHEDCYEVSFSSRGATYYYIIHADTGRISDAEVDWGW